MAEQKVNKELGEVIARAVIDGKFREALVKDTENTLYLSRVALSESEKKAITKLRLEDWNSLTVKELNDRLGSVMKVTIITVDI